MYDSSQRLSFHNHQSPERLLKLGEKIEKNQRPQAGR